MNNLQKLILILGAALTVYFLAFTPFTKDVTVNNPYYNPERKSLLFNTNDRYIYERQPDYPKNISCAIASGVGTVVLVYIAKTNQWR
jgi:hypothetical protein